VFLTLGYLAGAAVWMVWEIRRSRRRARLARPAAIAAVEALVLSSEESRRTFVAQASPYASHHFDTVGDRISRLVDALRWSSPSRQDFSTLEPLLAEAHRCLSIERKTAEVLSRWMERAPPQAPSGLSSVERRVLTGCMLVAIALVWALFPTARNPEPFLRVMLLMVGVFIAPVVARSWFSRRGARYHAAFGRALRDEGLEHDPLAMSVAYDVLARGTDPGP
jgi:hypothetical protein